MGLQLLFFFNIGEFSIVRRQKYDIWICIANNVLLQNTTTGYIIIFKLYIYLQSSYSCGKRPLGRDSFQRTNRDLNHLLAQSIHRKWQPRRLLRQGGEYQSSNWWAIPGAFPGVARSKCDFHSASWLFVVYLGFSWLVFPRHDSRCHR